MIRSIPTRTNLQPTSQPQPPTQPQQPKKQEAEMWCPLRNKNQSKPMTSHKSPPHGVQQPSNGNFSNSHRYPSQQQIPPRIPINPSEKDGEVNMLLQQYKSLKMNLNKVRGRLYSLGVNPENYI